MKVLIVEDDPVIADGLRIALSLEGYETAVARSVSEALPLIGGAFPFDICLLDVLLPDGDGYQVCQAIRKVSASPILFLTACSDEAHTVLALEQGADDYIAKPFRIRELMARIKAVLRRSSPAPDTQVIRIGKNTADLRSGKVFRGETEIFLSAAEYRLLLTFIRNRGQLLSRSQLLRDMWDDAGSFVNDNTLSVYVRRLRKKLEEEGGEPVIQTVRGIGYRMP